jgi:general secretion pathway protein M
MKHTTPHALAQKDWLGWLLNAHSSLKPREQLGLKIVLGLLILWLMVLTVWQPAQQIWFKPPEALAQLDLELQEMKRLQAEAQAIRAQTRIGAQEAAKVLEKITKSLLPQAQMTTNENTVQISFSSVSASVLSRWLMDVRESAQCTVVQSDLTRTNNPLSSSPNAKESVLWQGRLIVGLPH